MQSNVFSKRLRTSNSQFYDSMNEVISAANGYSTIFDMLEGKYMNDEITSLYKNIPTSLTSVQVSLGINCDLSLEPHFIEVKLEEPFNIDVASPMTYYRYTNSWNAIYMGWMTTPKILLQKFQLSYLN